MGSKTLEYYLGLPYKVEIYPEPDGSGYTAVLPELPGCMTCAPTLPELWEMVDDIKRLWLEVALEDGEYIPEPAPVEVPEYSGRFVVRLPRGLHRQLAHRAEQEHTSLNTLVVSVLSDGMGRWAVHRQYAQIEYRRDIGFKPFTSEEFAWLKPQVRTSLTASPSSQEVEYRWGPFPLQAERFEGGKRHA